MLLNLLVAALSLDLKHSGPTTTSTGRWQASQIITDCGKSTLNLKHIGFCAPDYRLFFFSTLIFFDWALSEQPAFFQQLPSHRGCRWWSSSSGQVSNQQSSRWLWYVASTEQDQEKYSTYTIWMSCNHLEMNPFFKYVQYVHILLHPLAISPHSAHTN